MLVCEPANDYQDIWQIVDIHNKNNIESEVLPNTKIFYFA